MKNIIVFLSLIILCSCSGNGIYYDLEKRGIASCSSNQLSTLYVEKIGGNELYLFEKSKTGKGIYLLQLDSLNDDFIITDLPSKKITKSEFRLEPLTSYRVTNNSNGDAAGDEIVVTTDEKGKIAKADYTSCQ